MTRADWVLLLALLAGLPWLYHQFWSSAPGQQLAILTAEGPPRILPLFPNQEIRIAGALGDSVIRIEQGRARFIASACSNKVCIQRGWIDASGETSACLPNRVSIQVLGRDARYDAVNF
ncbi:MAG TPA: NusG domain II-containing protein [Gammaproteobacteria bacterium]|nr:NusG domain II-containing protein [Gammaproteobacteria bacterium]